MKAALVVLAGSCLLLGGCIAGKSDSAFYVIENLGSATGTGTATIEGGGKEKVEPFTIGAFDKVRGEIPIFDATILLKVAFRGITTATTVQLDCSGVTTQHIFIETRGSSYSVRSGDKVCS